MTKDRIDVDALTLAPIVVDSEVALYACNGETGPAKAYVASTPESRSICNDPLVSGITYTRALEAACSKVLKALASSQRISLDECETSVLHILRGGLNFGLREAIADAFGWYRHCSIFLSAQRVKTGEAWDSWEIVESSYMKMDLKPQNDIVFGDVVATGTSLAHGLDQLFQSAAEQHATIRSITFFTIGGPRSIEIANDAVRRAIASGHPAPRVTVVFLEGIFGVPVETTPLRIKLEGTDLVRREALMAPQFIESQYESATFPLERCTIYDAGSRAFNLSEYLDDVIEYWEHVASLADRDGVDFASLVRERMPCIDGTRFGNVSLSQLAHKQVAALRAIMGGPARQHLSNAA
jgi:hypothetical protein